MNTYFRAHKQNLNKKPANSEEHNRFLIAVGNRSDFEISLASQSFEFEYLNEAFAFFGKRLCFGSLLLPSKVKPFNRSQILN